MDREQCARDATERLRAQILDSFVGPNPDQENVERFAQCIQSLLCHENELRNNRMTWFGTLQGFLWLSFAALHDETRCKQAHYLFWLLPALGIAICLGALSGIRAADRAVEVLFQRWKIYKANCGLEYYERPVAGLEPQQERSVAIPSRWFFPILISAGWVSCLVLVSTSLRC